MNNNKIALGILSSVIAVGLVYSQAPFSSQAKQGNNESLVDANNKALASKAEIINAKGSVTDSTLINPSQSTVEESSADIESITSADSAASLTKVRVVAKTHQLPADHRSASQPKAHGHESQGRHPEDNSLIPPGEPKKPLPNIEGKG